MLLGPNDFLAEEALVELESRSSANGGAPDDERLEPIIEGRTSAILPSKGGSIFHKITESDGTVSEAVKIAVIRPCVSRGRRLRGLPPIYTPRMLERDHKVFEGWPMFMDHLTEAIAEAVKRRGRSIRELGGRLAETWWDPTFETSEDQARGFQRGGVLAYAVPQPPIRAMLEADPKILRTSINAWPTGARPGRAPWGASGILIEGISKEPPGSVDWVLRDGAGGRVLQEDEEQVVALLESFYDGQDDPLTLSPTDDSYPSGHDPRSSAVSKPNFSEMSESEIRDWLKEHRPAIFEALTEAEAREATEPTRVVVAPAFAAETPAAGVTLDDVKALLAESLAEFAETMTTRVQETVEEAETETDRRVQEQLAERDEARAIRDQVHELIEGTDLLTPGWKARLKAEYVVLPSGPSAPLLMEAAEDKTREETVLADAKARVEEALKLIREAKGGPVVEDLGGGEGGDKKPKKVKAPKNEFMGFMMESEGTDDPEVIYTAIEKAVNG